MKLLQYLDNLLADIPDIRVVRNAKNLVKKIIEHKTIKLWTISDDKAEYERYMNLLDGSLKSVLADEQIADALREKSVSAFDDHERLFLLHDPCDIRKPHAKEMENLGKVRDLDGKIINGYSSFGSAVVDEAGKRIYPTDITIYSNRDDHYVKVAELKAYEKGKLQKSEDEEERQRAKQIEQYIEEDSYLNLSRVTQAQLQRVSEAFKAKNAQIRLCHVMDRQFDDENGVFVFIDEELEDEFVIRLKLSRNSEQTAYNEKKEKEVAIKLKVADFANKHRFVIPKFRRKGKVYQNVTCQVETDTLTLTEKPYTVTRMTLFDRKGKPIYKNPMLLLSNIKLKSAEEGVVIYRIYLLRAKIEQVFKFFKDVLGWEEFQIRDYEAIKNLLALSFFIGGYFYEIESALVNNQTVALIAQLGGGKGKVTRYYFFKGLEKMLILTNVTRFRKNHEVDDETWQEMLEFVT
jgi:hypothetical protein